MNTAARTDAVCLRRQLLLRCWLPIVCAAAVAGLSACSPKSGQEKSASVESAIPVTVGVVELMPLDRTLPVVGTLYPKDEATVSAEVEGKVEKTMAEFGDRVKAGQELAQIDTAAYQALVRESTANLAKAQANSANAEQELRRGQELRDKNIFSASDFDKASTGAAQAAAEVGAVEAADAMARLNLKRSHVLAPFDAAIAERVASAGDFMKVGTPLFRVVNDNVLKYIVHAPERNAGDVKKGQLVEFNVDAYPGETFAGKVYLISPSVNTATRAFAFGALVQNGDHRLKANSFARGELIIERNVPTPVVPLEAVVQFAGISKVFVVENGITRVREIKPGRIRGGKQEIVTGLKAGDEVVLTGQTKLQDGTKVRVRRVVAVPGAGTGSESSISPPQRPSQSSAGSASHAGS